MPKSTRKRDDYIRADVLKPVVLTVLVIILCGWTAQDVGQTSVTLPFSQAQGPLVTYGYPTGWTVNANLFGQGTVDPRYVVRITAPGQRMMIQLQDAQAPQLFVVPNGQPPGTPTMVNQMRASFQPYASGAQYAQFYAQTLYGQKCSHFSITDQAQAPMPPNVWLPPDVDRRRGTAGYAFFTCEIDGRPVDGAAFAATTPNRLPDGRVVWAVNWLYHFIAEASAGPQAFAIAAQVSASIHLDTATLNAMVAPRQPVPSSSFAPVRPDVAGTNAALAHQQDRFHQLMDSQTQQQNSFNNTLNGVAPATNPYSGQTELRPYGNGDNHHVNGLGNHIDTSDPFIPNGYTRMPNAPP